MTEYRRTDNERVVLRVSDNALIPDDPGNADYIGYLAWVAAGGVPDPYVAPATASAEPDILFDHENRIRAMEGRPELTSEEFAKARGNVR